jgi:hypothetical protein
MDNLAFGSRIADDDGNLNIKEESKAHLTEYQPGFLRLSAQAFQGERRL